MKNAGDKNKSIIIAALLILAVLTAAFFWGGNYSKSGKDSGAATALRPESEAVSPPATGRQDIAEQPGNNPGEEEWPDLPDLSSPQADPAAVKSNSSGPGMIIDLETGKDQYLTDLVPEGKPVPVDPQNTAASDRKLTCTLVVRCDTILDNMNLLDKDKWDLVPADGVIFAAQKVTFYEGESVFNVLLREMKQNKIHMEFVNTPLYNSAYIEGINNLYEFDVGELSGWVYKVNDGWFPNYGCSRYQLRDGDVMEWVYTCDLGKDVGSCFTMEGS